MRALQQFISVTAVHVATAVMFILIFTTTVFSAETEVSIPITTIWEQQFGDMQYSYESKAALLAPSGMLMVVGVYSSITNGYAPEGGWIWSIDASGKKISDHRYHAEILGSRLVGIDAFEFVGNDVVAIAGRLSNGKSFLIHVDSSGKIVRTTDLGNRWIAKLIQMNDGSLLLSGQKNGDMLLMKMDKSGGIVWERMTNRGKDDSLIDGDFIADHLLLVEQSGKQEQFSITDSMIGLVNSSIEGKRGRTIFSTKGRSASLASDENRVVLVYDASTAGDLDMRFVMFDKKSHALRKAPIIKGKLAVERFRVGCAGKAGFVVVGTVGGKMSLTFIDKYGQINLQHMRPIDDAFFLNPDVVGGEAAYVVSTMMVLTKDKQPRTLVNILKIDPMLRDAKAGKTGAASK
jgi:hypothetical protein